MNLDPKAGMGRRSKSTPSLPTLAEHHGTQPPLPGLHQMRPPLSGSSPQGQAVHFATPRYFDPSHHSLHHPPLALVGYDAHGQEVYAGGAPGGVRVVGYVGGDARTGGAYLPLVVQDSETHASRGCQVAQDGAGVYSVYGPGAGCPVDGRASSKATCHAAWDGQPGWGACSMETYRGCEAGSQGQRSPGKGAGAALGFEDEGRVLYSPREGFVLHRPMAVHASACVGERGAGHSHAWSPPQSVPMDVVAADEPIAGPGDRWRAGGAEERHVVLRPTAMLASAGFDVSSLSKAAAPAGSAGDGCQGRGDAKSGMKPRLGVLIGASDRSAFERKPTFAPTPMEEQAHVPIGVL